MKILRLFESEVSTGNASGKAGVPSIPFGRGYYQSGNNGACGTAFTPSGEPTSTTYKSMKHSKKNLKKKMKHLKKFEMWTTNTTGDFEINYGEKKPELSKVAINTIKFIKDNYNEIIIDILNEVKPTQISFNPGLKYTRIKLELDKESNTPFLYFRYYDYNEGNYSYNEDITNTDYDYLKDYFFNIYKDIRTKVHNKEKDEYLDNMKKLEDERIKKKADKYNI